MSKNSSDAGSVDVTSREGIRIISLNRPAKKNAITAAMCVDLRMAWEAFRDSDDRVAILTSEGDIFSAGADLLNPPSEFWRSFPDIGIDIGKPVIAALPGPAIGLGVGILMYCDLVVASSTCSLIYPEARIGISKGMIAAMCVRVPHKIAMELMLLGEPISAQRAYETGLINRVVAPEEVMAEAMRMATLLNRSAPKVIRMLKTLVSETLPISPVEKHYLTQAEVEKCTESQDAAEGLLSFRERRAPRFLDH